MKRKPTKKEWVKAVDPSAALEVAKRANPYIFNPKMNEVYETYTSLTKKLHVMAMVEKNKSSRR
mgnify:CR=1 FL=1